MKKFLLNLHIMAKLRFIPVKVQSILILIYMALATFNLNNDVALLTYWLIDPKEPMTKIISFGISLFVFLILYAFVAGTFVKKDEKA